MVVKNFSNLHIAGITILHNKFMLSLYMLCFQPIRIEHFKCSAYQRYCKLHAGLEDLKLIYMGGGIIT